MGVNVTQCDLERLRKEAVSAMRMASSPQHRLHVLRKCLALFPPDGQDALCIHQLMADLSLCDNPWQAALSARQLIRLAPNNDQSWATYALALSLMSHHRSAIKAYRQAVSLDPTNPWYAHDLGYLLDVHLNKPEEALRFLEMAHRAQPWELEFATSYAHALHRLGHISQARRVMQTLVSCSGTTPVSALPDAKYNAKYNATVERRERNATRYRD